MSSGPTPGGWEKGLFVLKERAWVDLTAPPTDPPKSRCSQQSEVQTKDGRHSLCTGENLSDYFSSAGKTLKG